MQGWRCRDWEKSLRPATSDDPKPVEVILGRSDQRWKEWFYVLAVTDKALEMPFFNRLSPEMRSSADPFVFHGVRITEHPHKVFKLPFEGEAKRLQEAFWREVYEWLDNEYGPIDEDFFACTSYREEAELVQNAFRGHYCHHKHVNSQVFVRILDAIARRFVDSRIRVQSRLIMRSIRTLLRHRALPEIAGKVLMFVGDEDHLQTTYCNDRVRTLFDSSQASQVRVNLAFEMN